MTETLNCIEKRFVNVARIFSLPANVNILLNSDMKEPRLSCLYGIHFLSVCWAILGQSAYLWRYQFTWNAIDLYEVLKTTSMYALSVSMGGTK